jgi:hypothetical protein
MYASGSSYPPAVVPSSLRSETKEYLVEKGVKRCFFIAYGFFTGAVIRLLMGGQETAWI